MKFAGLFVERVPVDESGKPIREPKGKKGKQKPLPTPRDAAGNPIQPPAQKQQPVRGQQPPQMPPAQPQHQQMPHPHTPQMPNPRAPQAQPSTPAAQQPQYQGVAPQYGQPLQGQPLPGHPLPGQPGQFPQFPQSPSGAVDAVDPFAAPTGLASNTLAVALRALVPQEHAAHLSQFGLNVIAAGATVTSEQARGWGASVLIISAECLGQELHLLQNPQLPTVFISPQPMMIPESPGVLQVQEPLRASEVAQVAREAVDAWHAAGRG